MAALGAPLPFAMRGCNDRRPYTAVISLTRARGSSRPTADPAAECNAAGAGRRLLPDMCDIMQVRQPRTCGSGARRD